MRRCWEADVDKRICFKEIVAQLKDNDAVLKRLNSNTNDDYVQF